MLSNKDAERKSIQSFSSLSMQDPSFNELQKPENLSGSAQHRDCSSLGRVFLNIKQWELNRSQQRKQKKGVGILACVLVICALSAIYLGAWGMSALFFLCSVVVAGYLPMISSPRPPATLRFLPNSVSPRLDSSEIQSPGVKAKTTDESRVAPALNAVDHSQPIDNFTVPPLRFFVPQKSKKDTFDIVAQEKLCSTVQRDAVLHAKI
ncbi:hypothetical protein CC99x_008420 [Candidatus Berkiella cookevillensis]|uniref:Uncharacterized protein n=1 Tax=Candidatus Berkiella cookevillensis TaxID=437022 RepID=A0A0Q9YFJ7_9GAMM|nr:hypothetical protein [Candidatus Berkiella cookevillensis]MCS5708923.1 hypothetical protein [Candidatus Berkiella cookevillensis]